MENKEIDVEIPFFVVDEQLQSKANVQDDYAILGDVLMGLCYWSNHTWPTLSTYSGNPKIVALPLIEKYFTWQWFLNEWVTSGPNAVDIDPYTNFGYTKLYRFDWFQYGLDTDDEIMSLSHAQLMDASHIVQPTRSGDTNICFIDPCTQRIAKPIIFETESEKIEIKELQIMNWLQAIPNPASKWFTLQSNFEFSNIEAIQIISSTGIDYTGKFEFDNTDHEQIRIKNINALQGLYFIKVVSDKGAAVIGSINLIAE